jgi:hypothetical protein
MGPPGALVANKLRSIEAQAAQPVAGSLSRARPRRSRVADRAGKGLSISSVV